MQDRRSETRFNTFRHGSLSFAGRTIACVVRDLSLSGACLEVDDPDAIPGRFIVLMPPHLNGTCEVAWRDSYRVGVIFVRSAIRAFAAKCA
jgi:hypothetical protein